MISYSIVITTIHKDNGKVNTYQYHENDIIKAVRVIISFKKNKNHDVLEYKIVKEQTLL